MFEVSGLLGLCLGSDRALGNDDDCSAGLSAERVCNCLALGIDGALGNDDGRCSDCLGLGIDGALDNVASGDDGSSLGLEVNILIGLRWLLWLFWLHSMGPRGLTGRLGTDEVAPSVDES